MPHPHTSDVSIVRERWKNGYHVAARDTKGHWVATRKWHGSESTRQVADKIQADNITDRESRYSYLIRGKTETGEYRNMSVFANKRVFIGKGKNKKLDTKPIIQETQSKYAQYNFKIKSLKLIFVYDFGVKL